MSISVNIDNVSREIPQLGDTNWGEKTTELLSTIVSAIKDRIKLSSDESISGTKTFLSPPTIPAPTLSSHPIRKLDLDSIKQRIQSAISSLDNNTVRVSANASNILAINNTIYSHSTSISSLRSTTKSNSTSISQLQTTISNSFPIGTIISVHPYAPTPNGQLWKLCDGNGVLGSNFTNHQQARVPNLTDTFLMGGTSHGSGGTNSKQLLSSNLPQHIHSMNHDHPVVGTSSNGGHSHYLEYSHSSSVRSGGGGGTGKYWLHEGTSSGTSSISTTSVSSHNHSVNIPHYTGNTGNFSGRSGIAFDNRPSYFKVKYYIRIS